MQSLGAGGNGEAPVLQIDCDPEVREGLGRARSEHQFLGVDTQAPLAKKRRDGTRSVASLEVNTQWSK